MIRQLNILRKQLSVLTFHKNYLFCIKKTLYKPMIPLTQRYTPIFISQQYETSKIRSVSSYFVYWLPAAGMLVNNYLSQWNGLNTGGFIALFVGGSLLRFLNKQIMNTQIFCLQVDPQLKWGYFTGKNFNLIKISKDDVFEQNQQQSLVDNYHPLKKQGIIVNIKQIEQNTSKTKIIKDSGQFLAQKFQKLIDRFKIALNQINFRLDLGQNELAEFQRNKQRLSPKQMFQTYENHNIIVQFIIKTRKNENLKMKYKIKTQNNINKKYHDYLLALALGYQIDTKANSIFKIQTNNNQNAKNQKKKKNQEMLREFFVALKNLKNQHIKKQQSNNNKDKQK